ncbi:MAG TPA: alpha/beta hydrolase [Gaiella sp.]|nr:alpha/beta hydrolase [Gaiella sp.]
MTGSARAGLHPEAAALLEQFESLGDPPLERSTPEAVRALRASRIRPPTVELPEIRDVDAGGVPGRLYRPSADDGLGLLLYLHGGGWVLGTIETHDHVARALAAESGCAVLSLDYRLAPEHPFPAGLEDALAAAGWAHDHADALGCAPAKIAIGGDSAGANLAAVVTQRSALPFAFQLLVYPVTDVRGGTASYEELSEGLWLTRAGMRWFLDHYLSGADGAPEDPRVSPLLADEEAFAASPPTLVITAELDPLRDEGEAYAARLAAAGVPVEVTRYDGMIHGFFSFAEFLSDGRRAVTQAAEALARAVGSAVPASGGRSS